MQSAAKEKAFSRDLFFARLRNRVRLSAASDASTDVVASRWRAGSQPDDIFANGLSRVCPLPSCTAAKHAMSERVVNAQGLSLHLL